MAEIRLSRRRLLATAGAVGALAGCSGGRDGEGETTAAGTTERSTDATDTAPPETTTEQPEAAVELADASLQSDAVAVGDPIAVEVTFSNTGREDGSTTATLEVDGETVATVNQEVPAGERRQLTLTSPPQSQATTVSVAVDGRPLGEVAVEAPEEIHVAPDGAADAPGTEDAPLSSIRAAVEAAGPGQTVRVHPGEYAEYVEFHTAGEPDAPITLTGPPDAVLKPPETVDHQGVSVGASHVHITGLTITGLYDADNPEDPDSYHDGKLIDLNPFAEHGEDYLEGLVVSPHRIGNAGQALVNSQMIRDCDIGGFEVVGPAGASWIFDESVDDHNGEIVYLGTADDNRRDRGFEGFDRTRNVRVHHIDNSAGHPHSELVDCKEGVRDVTIEYCTDGGGAQSDDSYYSQSIALGGYRCTVRWNVLRDAHGSGVEIPVGGAMDRPEALGEPEPGIVERMGTDNAIHGNVFTGNATDAVDFFGESHAPGHERNPLPEDQRALCGNLFDGFSDGAPGGSCPADLPSGDGVGHLGGDSPWSGDAPTREAAFAQHAMATDLETTVDGDSVATGEEFEATVTVTNTGDAEREVTFRLRVYSSVLASETVAVPAGETRSVQLGDNLPNPAEVAVTRNGQKIGYVRVRDDG